VSGRNSGGHAGECPGDKPDPVSATAILVPVVVNAHDPVHPDTFGEQMQLRSSAPRYLGLLRRRNQKRFTVADLARRLQDFLSRFKDSFVANSRFVSSSGTPNEASPRDVSQQLSHFIHTSRNCQYMTIFTISQLELLKKSTKICAETVGFESMHVQEDARPHRLRLQRPAADLLRTLKVVSYTFQPSLKT
jgi:hypothetical protein